MHQSPSPPPPNPSYPSSFGVLVCMQAISRAMKSTKVDKPGKVYVVTRKQKAGSMGTSSGGKVGRQSYHPSHSHTQSIAITSPKSSSSYSMQLMMIMITITAAYYATGQAEVCGQAKQEGRPSHARPEAAVQEVDRRTDSHHNTQADRVDSGSRQGREGRIRFTNKPNKLTPLYITYIYSSIINLHNQPFNLILLSSTFRSDNMYLLLR